MPATLIGKCVYKRNSQRKGLKDSKFTCSTLSSPRLEANFLSRLHPASSSFSCFRHSSPPVFPPHLVAPSPPVFLPNLVVLSPLFFLLRWQLLLLFCLRLWLFLLVLFFLF